MSASSSAPSPRHVTFDQAAALAQRVPQQVGRVGVFVDPENVAEAVATTGARLVDVSSGVESALGVKDQTKIAAFLKTIAAL